MAILSADVAGYSPPMGDDKAATIEILTKYRQIFADHIARLYGRVVDSPGDNLLAACDGKIRVEPERPSIRVSASESEL